MINKPSNWDRITPSTGTGFPKLPADGYVVKIYNAQQRKSDSGYEYLELEIDIYEGKYKDYFKKEHDANTFDNARYKGYYRQGLPQNDNAARYFKGMIQAVEDSNPGYTWDWDENSLKGKIVGCLFRDEEWEYNGKTGFRTAAWRMVGAEKIRTGDYTVPAPKVLETPAQEKPLGSSLRTYEEIDDEDIPF